MRQLTISGDHSANYRMVLDTPGVGMAAAASVMYCFVFVCTWESCDGCAGGGVHVRGEYWLYLGEC